MLRTSTIALAQTTAAIGDIEKNVANHLRLIEDAIAKRADAIAFAELSLTGYTLRDLNFDVALDPATDPRLEPIRKKSNEITIICGGVERADSGGVYNAAFVFEDGKLIHTHRKIYPPTYGIFEERRYFIAGNKALAFDSKRLGKIGVLVCEDLWHPSLPYLLAHQGAELIVTIAASPTRLGHTADDDTPANYKINREHHSAYARLLSVYIAFVNRVGVEDGVNFWGGSEVVAPTGEAETVASFFDEELVIASLSHEAIRHSREQSRHMLDEDLLLTREMIDETILRNRQ